MPYCEYTMEPPQCVGHRCTLGNCVPFNKMCDGNVDCHDKSDEDEDMCKQKKQCVTSEFKCRNGHCVHKTKFCDLIDDCGDGSDEPYECTCLDYLK